MRAPSIIHPQHLQRAWVVLLLILLVSCQASPLTGRPSSTTTPQDQTGQGEPVVSGSQAADGSRAFAEVTFEVQLPLALAEGQNLYIEFLDEVTGLAFNPSRAQMSTSDNIYFGIKIPILMGSVVKYRYFRDSDPSGIEYNAGNEQVRYRMYVVDGPGVVRDIVAGWRHAPFQAQSGRIQGQVANQQNNAPVVNALVAAGGAQTLTSSDGSFVLEGLPPGTHNMVVYSLDGAFQPFQQGAVVAVDSTTPAFIPMRASRQVEVTFLVTPPADGPNGAPVRLIGNTYALGNTFADLSGGMSVVASRAPLMQYLPDGRYSLKMRLPAGLDLRYKFSLGDGFWNAERDSAGQVRLRQLIVPDQSITVESNIDTWNTPGFSPVRFTVTVPEDTPPTDTVAIQFNPFGWTQPIPMWPIGRNQWFYILYSPLNAFPSASYRYCRNEQCGEADADSSRGPEAAGMPFTPQETAQDVNDSVASWAWNQTLAQPVVIPGVQITQRGESFQAGIELAPSYSPSWQPYMAAAFQSIKEKGANVVVLDPTWRLTHQNLPVMAPVAGQDALWPDLTQMSSLAQQVGLSTSIHPVLRYPQSPQDWWMTADRNEGWWQTWFERYRTFAVYHADLATQTGAKSLILGDETILPAFPNGVLADGQPSGVPAGADEQWQKIIAAVRSRFAGKLIFMLPYTGALPAVPEFLKDVDIVYVQLMPPLLDADPSASVDLEARIAEALDGDILEMQEKTSHPVILGLRVPSAKGVLDGCVGPQGNCSPIEDLLRPAANLSNDLLGLEDQVYVYSAALAAANQRSWITGFYAAGYYPPVELRDLSPSVRGKPAADVLWYWYPRMTGQASQ
jgi:hypothetical protein